MISPGPPPGWPLTIGSEFVPKFYICSHVTCTFFMLKNYIDMDVHNPFYRIQLSHSIAELFKKPERHFYCLDLYNVSDLSFALRKF